MSLVGITHEITNFQNFIFTYLVNQNNPDSNSFSAMANTKVKLYTRSNQSILGIGGYIKRTAYSDSNGNFTINTNGLNVNADCVLKIYKPYTINIFGGDFQVYRCVQRTGIFQLSQIDGIVNLYSGLVELDDSAAITQQEINDQINSAMEDNDAISNLEATIEVGEIDVEIDAKAGPLNVEINFEIELTPYTGNNLNKFIKHEIDDFDVDLPGPDFITTLCADEDEIEDQVEDEIYSLFSGVNQEINTSIIDTIADEFNIAPLTVETIYNENITMTFYGLSYPQNGGQRSILPRPYFGVPRIPFGNASNLSPFINIDFDISKVKSRITKVKRTKRLTN